MKILLALLFAPLIALAFLTQPVSVSAYGDDDYYRDGKRYYDDHDKYEKERRREERKEMKEMRREERRIERERERDARNWYDDQWRWRTQRYFGGTIAPYPGESYESFSRRARQQCNAQWNRCANYCNTIRDPYQRAACVANCNNDLYECSAQFPR